MKNTAKRVFATIAAIGVGGFGVIIGSQQGAYAASAGHSVNSNIYHAGNNAAPAHTKTSVAQEKIIPIADIQGAGDATPFEGQEVTTVGVVTAVYAVGGLNGYYIQTPDSAASTDGRSNAIFVYDKAGASDRKIGESVRVKGTATEYKGLTELTKVTVTHTDSIGTVTPKQVAWPATNAEREKLEGMLIAPQGDILVADNYKLNTYGSLTLATGGKLLVNPTEAGRPASAEAEAQVAYNQAHSVVLDDGTAYDFLKTAKDKPLPFIDASHPVTVGAKVTFNKPVVVDYRYDAWTLQPQTPVLTGVTSDVAFSNVRESAPAQVGGDISIGTFNVLNYFTDLGKDEPGCKAYTDRLGHEVESNGCAKARGAWSESAFNDQQAKIVSAINKLDASVIGLEEIENSAMFGKDRDDALSKLVGALNKAKGSAYWAFAPSPKEVPTVGGTDVIRTAFIYQPAKISYLADSGKILDDAVFKIARAPYAATFQAKDRPDFKFVAIVNHFKSKRAGDGQVPAGDEVNPAPAANVGGWNATRTKESEALVAFAKEQQSKQGTDKVFLIGDFNAYSKEDPIVKIEDNGFIDLRNANEYSYVYNGEAGSLDHAFASPAVKPFVTGVDIWTINAHEPVALEYSRRNYNVTELYTPDQFRASDHNPKIIGIKLPDNPAGAGAKPGDAKGDVKAGVQAGAQADVKAGAQAGAQADTKSDVKSDVKAGAALDANTGAKNDANNDATKSVTSENKQNLVVSGAGAQNTVNGLANTGVDLRALALGGVLVALFGLGMSVFRRRA